MSRSALFVALMCAMLVPTPARSGEKCPMDVASCLEAYARMRERPWLGVEIDVDSTGARRVMRVIEGSPAEKAGIRAGDVLERINGKALPDWFAGKGGWSESDEVACIVLRENRETKLKLGLHRISDEMLGRLIGVHMLESHLAYMGVPDSHGH